MTKRWVNVLNLSHHSQTFHIKPERKRGKHRKVYVHALKIPMSPIWTLRSPMENRPKHLNNNTNLDFLYCIPEFTRRYNDLMWGRGRILVMSNYTVDRNIPRYLHYEDSLPKVVAQKGVVYFTPSFLLTQGQQPLLLQYLYYLKDNQNIMKTAPTGCSREWSIINYCPAFVQAW